jgi:hypothetical protein
MFTEDQDDCLDTMVDLLCYEMSCGRLSAEMEALLAAHLERCSACRKRACNFLELLECIGDAQASPRVH